MAEQAGRVALVTGANTGIGFEAALQLARKGAHVLLGCRDQRRAEQAIERIQAAVPTALAAVAALGFGRSCFGEGSCRPAARRPSAA